MAGRRTSLASLAGQKVEDVPGRSDAVLLSLPLEKLHCTRFNPRRNFGTDEELREFGLKLQKEQLQPAVVVSRTAYLKLWPGEADNVGTASYVIANGERRYRASHLVGRPVLEVVHREDVARSRADFLDAVQSENNDRQDLDPIERAIAIETMVTELGGADHVAVYYSKTKGWVSQQRKLLKLVPELQDLVSAGEMPVRVARDIAGLPADVQAAAWQEEVDRRRLEKEAGARLRAQAANPAAPVTPSAPRPVAAQDERFTAVNQESPLPRFTAVKPELSPAPQPTPSATVQNPVLNGRPASPAVVAREAVPEPRQHPAEADPDEAAPVPADEPAASAGGGQLPRLPYDDGQFLALHLIRKMPTEALVTALRILNRHAAEQGLDVAPESAV